MGSQVDEGIDALVESFANISFRERVVETENGLERVIVTDKGSQTDIALGAGKVDIFFDCVE